MTRPLARLLKFTTIWAVLSMAISLGWITLQFDVENVFLHGILREEIYMCQPLGFPQFEFLNHVWRLWKAIYG